MIILLTNTRDTRIQKIFGPHHGDGDNTPYKSRCPGVGLLSLGGEEVGQLFQRGSTSLWWIGFSPVSWSHTILHLCLRPGCPRYSQCLALTSSGSEGRSYVMNQPLSPESCWVGGTRLERPS